MNLKTTRVMHIWDNYAEGLFDMSHRLCIQNHISSELVCMYYVDNGIIPGRSIFFTRIRKPEEAFSKKILDRAVSKLYRFIHRYKFLSLLKKRISIFKPTVLHVHFGTTGLILCQSDVLNNHPYVVSFYGADISQSLSNSKNKFLYKRLLDNASSIHVLCEESARRLVSIGCNEDKIIIANLPVDFSSIEPVANYNPNTYSNSIRLLMPARFVEKKGHVLAFKAISALISDGYDIRLTCFGYGPTEWLFEEIHRYGLDNCVNVIDNKQSSDFLSIYNKLLRECNFILCPSIKAESGDDEGGPALSVIIGQAAGIPVIVSDFPGSERSVRDGVEGIVVRSGDINDLKNGIHRAINSKECWQSWGAAGKSTVLASFSQDEYFKTIKQSLYLKD